MENWKENGLTADGQFACDICNGTKQMIVNVATKKLGECGWCNGTGYMVDCLNTQLGWAKNDTNRERENFKKLEEWVRRTSKCSKCQGNSYKTPGGCPCEECGLEGTQPWGG